MKTNIRSIILLVVVAVILVAASIAEIVLVFNVTSTQSKQSGEDRLQVIGSELEETISDAKLKTMQLAIEVRPYLDNDNGREQLTDIIQLKKQENL